MSDTDGIDDALRSATQVTAGIIARAAEIHAREQEAAAKTREHQIDTDTTNLAQHTDRAAAEQQTDLARLAVVHDPGWWQTAAPRDIAHSWQIATTSNPSRDTSAAIDVIQQQVAARYGITLTSQPAAELEQAIEQAAAEHQPAGRERSTADVPDGHEDRGYDSPEQREARTRRYKASGNPRAAEARRVADTAQAASAIYATTGTTRRRRARRPNTQGPRSQQRTDRGR